MAAIVGHANHVQTPKGAVGISVISAGYALLIWWIRIHYGEFCKMVSSFELRRVELCVKPLFYSQFENKESVLLVISSLFNEFRLDNNLPQARYQLAPFWGHAEILTGSFFFLAHT